MLGHFSHVQLCHPMDCSPSRLLCPWDSPGKNTGAGHLSELHPVNEVNTKGQFFRASFGKKPQVPKTARQAASLPGDISRGKRSSMPQPKTRPDSPVPSLQGPCDRSLKSEVPCGSCLNWR